MSLHEIFAVDEMSDDEVRQLNIDGQAPIAIYRIDGEYYATDDTCTHGEASLAEGDIEDGEIVCPFHMGAFDIRTGEATVPPCVTALTRYRTHIKNGKVFLELKP